LGYFHEAKELGVTRTGQRKPHRLSNNKTCTYRYTRALAPFLHRSATFAARSLLKARVRAEVLREEFSKFL
jgi:hypothetical protein